MHKITGNADKIAEIPPRQLDTLRWMIQPQPTTTERRAEVDVKTDHMSGIDSGAIKISPSFSENASLPGLSTNGTTIVLSTEKDMLESLLLDSGCVTNVRSVAAGTLASDNLIRRNASVATDFGTGVQARLRLRALAMVKSLREAVARPGGDRQDPYPDGADPLALNERLRIYE
ncbi:hypothetical protein [Bradyrhizobium sp. RT11b]|uniref:hypothetical protein n=1 Tax=Bradyrhizobium sp. RT11b TaxID=3156332 RepID=UPI003392BDB4